MPYLPILKHCAVAITLILASASALAKPDLQSERTSAAYLLALGRGPTAAEVADWKAKGEASVAEIIESLGSQVNEDTVKRAYFDAFGSEPSPSEIKSGVDSGRNYTELVEAHVESISENAEAYAAVLQRAYRFVINRDVYKEEIAYWGERDRLSYTMLVGCIEDWARRNQPGLMVTAGTPTISINCVYLETARLSPDVAEEARKAIGLSPADDSDKHVIAASAGSVVAGGGIHFVATLRR